MRPSYVLYLRRFYGDLFNREFGREGKGVKFNRVPVYDLERLLTLSNVYQGKNCNVYCSVYGYKQDNLLPVKKPCLGYVYPYESNVILDRIFIDFDKNLTDKAQIEYDNLLSNSSKVSFYKRLIEQGQAKDSIIEAKKVYKYIVDHFQGDPMLVFSGAKGCHLYIHFSPVKLCHPKDTILQFVNTLEKELDLKCVDDAVKGDFSRVSRIPTSKHPKTGLHESRMILALICKWSNLSPEDTVEALKIFTEDKSYYDPTKHLQNIQQIEGLNKYLFTYNSMKKT